MKPDAKKVVINGPRPSPLMIIKDSHLIRKPSCIYSTSVNVSESNPHQQQQKKPIIIYTQSPKVIHTKPQDFMALVQRLTGMAVPSNKIVQQHQPLLEASENFGSSLSDESNNSIKQEQEKNGTWAGDETSSGLTDHGETCVKEEPYVEHSHYNSILGFADMPLFTPNYTDFLCSSRSVYKYSDSSPYGVLGSLLSPSGLEFMKELPEY